MWRTTPQDGAYWPIWPILASCRSPACPVAGLKRRSFSEALNHRGLDQMLALFERLSHTAATLVTTRSPDLGALRALDGSLIDATLSMTWADSTTTTHKAKVHL